MVNLIKKGSLSLGTLFTIVIGLFLLLADYPSFAQELKQLPGDDSLALEQVLVEKYYIFKTRDCTDSLADLLPEGSVTYRIFIDMKPGYSLQVVYGSPKHGLYFKTSTEFFNDQTCYAETGFNIDIKKLSTRAVAFDSWITMGAAARGYTGIPLDEDEVGFSFISNRKSMSEVDGLTKAILPQFRIFNLDLEPFRSDMNASCFTLSNGGWAALGGIKGPTEKNRVLIAQLTTTGKLSFELNVQIGTSDGRTLQFVAKNPENGEFLFKGLSYNSTEE